MQVEEEETGGLPLGGQRQCTAKSPLAAASNLPRTA